MNDNQVLEILCKSGDLKFDTLHEALWVRRKAEPSTPVIQAVLRLKKSDHKEIIAHQSGELSWLRNYIFEKLENLCPSDCYNLLVDTYQASTVDLSEYLIFATIISSKYTESVYPNLYKVIESFKKEEN